MTTGSFDFSGDEPAGPRASEASTGRPAVDTAADERGKGALPGREFDRLLRGGGPATSDAQTLARHQLGGDVGRRAAAERRAAREVHGRAGGGPDGRPAGSRVLTGNPLRDFPCDAPAKLRLRLWCRWVGVDGRRSLGGALVRQTFPIIAYTGANGGGKTACAVYDCLRTLAGRSWSCRNTGHRHLHAERCPFNPVTGRGCACPLADVPPTSDYRGPIPPGGRVEGDYLVWSTTRLLGPDGRDHPRYRPLDNLAKLVYAEHAELLLDEVPGIADARDHQSMPPELRKAIYECRRRDVVTRWTSVDFSAADTRLRQITQAVVFARGFAAVRSSVSGVWTERRLLRWRTYDRADFEHFTAGTRERVKPLGQQWVWRPGHQLERSYDTLAPVLALSVATEAGTCLTCGGSRPRRKCGCDGPEAVVQTLPRRQSTSAPGGGGAAVLA